MSCKLIGSGFTKLSEPPQRRSIKSISAGRQSGIMVNETGKSKSWLKISLFLLGTNKNRLSLRIFEKFGQQIALLIEFKIERQRYARVNRLRPVELVDHSIGETFHNLQTPPFFFVKFIFRRRRFCWLRTEYELPKKFGTSAKFLLLVISINQEIICAGYNLDRRIQRRPPDARRCRRTLRRCLKIESVVGCGR